MQIEPEDFDFDDLIHKSGSASYTPKGTAKMSRHEFFKLSMSLAPFKSDGVEDQEEWNLFEQYLTMTFDNVEDLRRPIASVICSTCGEMTRQDKPLPWL